MGLRLGMDANIVNIRIILVCDAHMYKATPKHYLKLN